MESLLQSLKGHLGQAAYDVLEKIAGYIDAHYTMDTLFDGVDELKFRRSGKTLVTLYLRGESIITLIIFGKYEREQFEQVQDTFSEFIQNYYSTSRTYHDGKWMYINLQDDSYLNDVIRLIEIKKKPNSKVMSMCGYRCDLCKAYSPNIKKEDQRDDLSRVWKSYYEINISPGEIYCDGCRSTKKDAKRIDVCCPVRKCVIERDINSCADCKQYPCEAYAK